MNGGPAKLGALDVPGPERDEALGAPSPAHVAAVVPLGFFGVLKAIRQSRTLTSTERFVLLLIAGNVDQRTGLAAIGVPHLAEDSGFAERTIERTLVSLLEPRAGFEPAAWLWKADELSEYGTNLYRVTPIAEDARPKRQRKARPPTQCRGSTPDPRHSVGGHSVIHDHGSPPPPIVDRGPPRSTIGHSASSSAGSSPRTERGESPPPVVGGDSVKGRILTLLSESDELRRIACPEVVKAIADEGRSLATIAAALAALARDAASAAGVGDPMSPAVLAKKARTYVRDQRDPAGASTSTPRAPEAPELPHVPGCLDDAHERLAEVLAAVSGIGSGPLGADPIPRSQERTIVIETTGEDVTEAPCSAPGTKAAAWKPPQTRRK